MEYSKHIHKTTKRCAQRKKLPNRPSLPKADLEIEPLLLLPDLVSKVVALQAQVMEMSHLIKGLDYIAKMVRLLEDIHKLHFAAVHLPKGKTLVDKYLAEIIIGKPQKSKIKSQV